MLKGQGAPLPTRAALHSSGLYLQMRDIGAAELRDPFMKDTIARLPGPEHYVQVAPEHLGRADAAAAPAGLIFHVSRCGSTLLSQMLKQAGTVAYSEPPPLNEVLKPPQPWPEAQMIGAIRSLGAALADHAGGQYVIKCTSWNTLWCGLLTEAFVHTPWVICVRDPLEVCVSVLARPPPWLLGTDEMAQRFVAIIDPEGEADSNEELVARMFAAVCDAAARLDPSRGRLIEYTALPAAGWEVVALHFGIGVDAQARGRMGDAAQRDAKAPLSKPAARFDGDSGAKRAAATPALREAVDAHARPALERLRVRFRAKGVSRDR